MRLLKFSGRHKRRRTDSERDQETEPAKSVSKMVIDRRPAVAVERQLADQRRELSVRARLRDNTAVAIVERQQTVARRARKRHAVFDRAHNRHARVAPVVLWKSQAGTASSFGLVV